MTMLQVCAATQVAITASTAAAAHALRAIVTRYDGKEEEDEAKKRPRMRGARKMDEWRRVVEA